MIIGDPGPLTTRVVQSVIEKSSPETAISHSFASTHLYFSLSYSAKIPCTSLTHLKFEHKFTSRYVQN